MALYMAVMTTTLVVSTLSLSALTVVRIERRQSSIFTDRMAARGNARSAIELALRVVANDPDWRTTYSNGVATAQQTLGPSGRGTVSWLVQDSDGNLKNKDVSLRLKGIGCAGSAVQAISVQIASSQVGPTQLRSHTTATGASTDPLASDKWWGQYLKVALPSGGNAWKVTGVELFISRGSANRTFRVRLYRPLGNGGASSTIIDSTDMNSNALSSTMSWQTVAFTADQWLDPDDAICFALETTASGTPLNLSYRSSGASEVNSALIRGNPNWNSVEPDKAFRYRINGYYSTSIGVHTISGTWKWEAP